MEQFTEIPLLRVAVASSRLSIDRSCVCSHLARPFHTLQGSKPPIRFITLASVVVREFRHDPEPFRFETPHYKRGCGRPDLGLLPGCVVGAMNLPATKSTPSNGTKREFFQRDETRAPTTGVIFDLGKIDKQARDFSQILTCSADPDRPTGIQRTETKQYGHGR